MEPLSAANRQKTKVSDRGFTLVEIVVVLVIIAILAAIAIPTMLGFVNKAKQSELYAQIRLMNTSATAVYERMYATGLFDDRAYTELIYPTPAHPSDKEIQDVFNELFEKYTGTEIDKDHIRVFLRVYNVNGEVTYGFSISYLFEPPNYTHYLYYNSDEGKITEIGG